MRKSISPELIVFLGGLVLVWLVLDRTKHSTHHIERVIHEISHLHENHLKLQHGREQLLNNVKRVEEIVANQQGLRFILIMIFIYFVITYPTV